MGVFEHAAVAECSNRVDDDGDGRVDHPTDPGCADSQDTSGVPNDLSVASPRTVEEIEALMARP